MSDKLSSILAASRQNSRLKYLIIPDVSWRKLVCAQPLFNIIPDSDVASVRLEVELTSSLKRCTSPERFASARTGVINRESCIAN